MTLSSRENSNNETKAKIEAELAKLGQLIKEDNLEEIKKIVTLAKQQLGYLWYRAEERYVDSAVRDAIRLGQEETVQIFLNAGVWPTEYIGIAAEAGNLSMVKLLVKKGAKISARDDYLKEGDDSAIREAVRGGHAEVVDYLLENGAKTHGILGSGGKGDTYLAYSAKSNHEKVVALLIQHGASSHIGFSLVLAGQKYGETIKSNEYALERDYNENNRKEIVAKLASSNGYMASHYEDKLKEFDENKHKIERIIEERKSQYESIVRTLMDYSAGCNFYSDRAVEYMQTLDSIAGISFIGVSLEGEPITRKSLVDFGLKGAEDAIVTLDDLERVPDESRRSVLRERLDVAMSQQGSLVRDGVVNLVPLWCAAEDGDLDAVNARLKAGVSPNSEKKSHNRNESDTPAIVLAAKNGHTMIALVLCNHADFDKKTLVQAIRAAQRNHHAELAKALAEYQDVNQPDANGNTLLHHAVLNGNVAEVKRLLDKGADVNRQGRGGFFPLHFAASASYNIQSGDKSSKKHIEIIEILLAYGANPNYSIPSQGTPMEVAGCAGSAKALAILLPVTHLHKLKRVKKSSDDDKLTHKVRRQFELKYGVQNPKWYADVMFKSYESKEWLEILALLKQYNADLNVVQESGFCTLLDMLMVDFPPLGDVESVMRDIARNVEGCESGLPYDSFSSTQRDLMHSSLRGFSKKMRSLEFLLENGADPSVRYNHGNTALHRLIKKVNLQHIAGGYARVIDKCLAKGFQIDTRDGQGRTLLHVAASMGDLAAVKYLLSRGADINATDEHGRTPLFYAGTNEDHLVPYASPITAKYLLQHGAKPDVCDNNGITPYEFSKADSDSYMQDGSYTSWDRDMQREWLEPFLTFQRLVKSDVNLVEEPERKPEYSEEMTRYLNSVQQKLASKQIQSILYHKSVAVNDMENKDKLLLSVYCDDVTNKLMCIPVVLNERVYNLDTLLHILRDDKKDPFTGNLFDLSDIKPAQSVAVQLFDLCDYLTSKYAANTAKVSAIGHFSSTTKSDAQAMKRSSENADAKKENSDQCLVM